jgi:hypothetical protein
MTTSLSTPAGAARTSRARLTKHRWLTFGEVVHLLRLPRHARRYLQRRLLGSAWEDILQIQRLAAEHSRELPTPPDSPAPWVMSRRLVLTHRRALLIELFG